MYKFEAEPHHADEYEWVEDPEIVEHILEAVNG